MFKRFVSVFLCVLLVFGVFSVVHADETVELRCQFWFDSADMAGWQAIIDKFETENPGIKVVLESTTFGDYWTKLNTQTTSNSVADVFGMVSMYSQDYMASGVAMPLKQFAEQDEGIIGFDNYYQAIMSAYTYNDDFYFLPYDMSTELLLVNKDILADCGIEYKPEGYTREDIEVMGPILKDKGYYTLKVCPRDWTYYDLLTRSGCAIIDDEGKLNLNNDAVIEVTQYYADLMAKGYAPYQADKTDYFTSGMCAMTMVNPEVAASNIKNMEADLDVIAAYPTEIEGGKVIAEGGSWGIYSGTQHPEEAWKLLKALTDAYCSINMVAGDFRGIPTVNDPTAVDAFLSSEFAPEHAQLFLDMLSDSTRADYPNRTAVEGV